MQHNDAVIRFADYTWKYWHSRWSEQKKNEKKRTMQVHWNFTNNIENNNTHQPPYCETNWHRLTTASHFCSNALKVISTCKDL